MARKPKSSMKDPSAAMANNGRQPMGSSAYSLADAPSRTEFNTGMVVKKAGGGVGRPEAATAAKKQPVTSRPPRPAVRDRRQDARAHVAGGVADAEQHAHASVDQPQPAELPARDDGVARAGLH